MPQIHTQQAVRNELVLPPNTNRWMAPLGETQPSPEGLIVTHIFGWTPGVPQVHASSPNGAPYPALRDQPNKGVKELTTECLPAAGGSRVGRNTRFARRAARCAMAVPAMLEHGRDARGTLPAKFLERTRKGLAFLRDLCVSVVKSVLGCGSAALCSDIHLVAIRSHLQCKKNLIT